MRRIASLVFVCLLLCQTVFVLAGAADSWACLRCETVNTGNFCSECGEKRPLGCPLCKEPLPASGSAKFCPSCGANLAESLAGATPATPAVEAPAAAPAAPLAKAAAPTPIKLEQVIYEHSGYSRPVLTRESYPELVFVEPGSRFQIMERMLGPSKFLHIPCRDDSVPARFQDFDGELINLDERIYYWYTLSTVFEVKDFSSKDGMIMLKDGSDGVAIFVRSDRPSAEALIAVPQMGESVKLRVYIRDDLMPEDCSGQEHFDRRVALITAEVERVLNTMQVRQHDQYWSIGAYASLKMSSGSLPQDYYVFTDPDFIVATVGDDHFAGLYIPGKDGEGKPITKWVTFKIFGSGLQVDPPPLDTQIARHVLRNGMEVIALLKGGQRPSITTEIPLPTSGHPAGDDPVLRVSLSLDHLTVINMEDAVLEMEQVLSHLSFPGADTSAGK